MAFAMQTRSAAASVRSARNAVVGPRIAFRVAPAQRRVIARAGAVSDIVEKLKTLTLLEASELVAEIEKTFGVDASAATAAPAGGAPVGAAPAAAAPVEEVKTAFDVVLESIPADKKVAVYKIVRSIAGIAVNQVKDFTATLPKVLKEGVSKEEAEEAKRQLTDIGAGAKVV